MSIVLANYFDTNLTNLYKEMCLSLHDTGVLKGADMLLGAPQKLAQLCVFFAE